ncbi:uncharacterized protein EDB91DRAFT_495045 [Suillus paluster]|uniref:uncharacterized protein n=1 Tax=Suillus paluster TaxID=48578 RepID=UPI001B875D3B|nr:uncharacterized protein EDB91DRAFT_495045 [Suillus paluster]KAG1736878.1 hypothetical protein EDB91DRAFT_495045 [Suillus paluster]
MTSAMTFHESHFGYFFFGGDITCIMALSRSLAYDFLALYRHLRCLFFSYLMLSPTMNTLECISDFVVLLIY